jgi:hypothetical protein
MEEEDIDGLTNDLDSRIQMRKLKRTSRWC